MRNRFIRILIISILIALLAAYNYNHLSGAEVDTIHIVTLLICGAGIGMFLISISGLFFWKKDK
jgi:hypothetical protein